MNLKNEKHQNEIPKNFYKRLICLLIIVFVFNNPNAVNINGIEDTKIVCFGTKHKEVLNNIPDTIQKEKIVDNKIIFCGEKLDSSQLDFFLEFTCSTETQNSIFKPKDKRIVERSWRISCNDTTSTACGRWQMLEGTRKVVAKFLGVKVPTKKEFLRNKNLQIRFIMAFFEMNNVEFERNEAYVKYGGRFINGYWITKSGMLGMSQALGVSGTISWIKHGCKPKDLPKGAPIADRRLTLQIF